MLRSGSLRTLARVNSASAIQTLACAAATISGRASESRRAVARLIGKRRSVGSRGVGFRLIFTSKGEGPSDDGRPAPGTPGIDGGMGEGKAGLPGRAPAPEVRRAVDAAP